VRVLTLRFYTRWSFSW